MASVISRIQSLMHSLTPSEAKVADFCLNNPSAVMVHPINEVAAQAGVSVASVSRLAVSLGYRDWKELRLGLAKTTGDEEEEPVFPDILPGDSDEAVARKVVESDILSLRETHQQTNIKDVMQVVRALLTSKRVVFFGSGGSGCIARDESLRFAHLDLVTEAYRDEFEGMLKASRMKAGEIAFGFSNSGRSRATVNVLQEAKSNGAFTVGVANFRNTPLEEASDVFFCTSFPLRSGHVASLTARIAVMGLMDVIYVLAAHHGGMSDNFSVVDNVLEGVRFSAREGKTIRRTHTKVSKNA